MLISILLAQKYTVRNFSHSKESDSLITLVYIMSKIVLITAGNGFDRPSALKPTPLASWHRPFRQLGGRYVCPCYARRYLLAPISNNFCS